MNEKLERELADCRHELHWAKWHQRDYRLAARRLRAALEEIVRIIPAKVNYDDTYWTGVNAGVDECKAIADRALKAEAK